MKTELCDKENNLIITDQHIGHLLPVKCGHRGTPNKIEERMLETLLRESCFLDSNSDPSQNSKNKTQNLESSSLSSSSSSNEAEDNDSD